MGVWSLLVGRGGEEAGMWVSKRREGGVGIFTWLGVGIEVLARSEVVVGWVEGGFVGWWSEFFGHEVVAASDQGYA